MSLSTAQRSRLYVEINHQIRRSIAGGILFNQRVADRFGFRLTDMQCLNILDLLGPVTPGTLAAHTRLTTGGVTVMLDRLEKTGLVQRQPNPDDRRSLLVRVNSRKLKKMHAVYARMSQHLESVLAETSDSDLQAVANFLMRMNTVPLASAK